MDVIFKKQQRAHKNMILIWNLMRSSRGQCSGEVSCLTTRTYSNWICHIHWGSRTGSTCRHDRTLFLHEYKLPAHLLLAFSLNRSALVCGAHSYRMAVDRDFHQLPTFSRRKSFLFVPAVPWSSLSGGHLRRSIPARCFRPYVLLEDLILGDLRGYLWH